MLMVSLKRGLNILSYPFHSFTSSIWHSSTSMAATALSPWRLGKKIFKPELFIYDAIIYYISFTITIKKRFITVSVSQKQRIDKYIGYLLIGIFLPITRLLGILLKRDHKLHHPP